MEDDGYLKYVCVEFGTVTPVTQEGLTLDPGRVWTCGQELVVL